MIRYIFWIGYSGYRLHTRLEENNDKGKTKNPKTDQEAIEKLEAKEIKCQNERSRVIEDEMELKTVGNKISRIW